MTTQMLKYIKSNIDNSYAMEVLYYSIRKAIADNDFTFKVTTSIKISNKFLEPSVDININHKFSKQIEAFSLLLSVRALMLDKTLIKYCHGDMLLFEDYPMHKFGWIAYTTMIMDCMNDEEFSDIYYLLEEVYSGNKLSNDDKEFFVNSTTVPEYKNLPNYYKKFAKDKKGVTSEVICNNAFVCEDELIEYVVTENVAYIGNTAFSYCKNLTTITFERKDLLFGQFPIVECDNLRRIMVPIGCEEYYKNALPFYKDIIFSEETLNNPEASDTPINPTILKTVFDKKVTSYKYFWFLSIITLLKEKGELTISFQDLVIRMAAQAWPIIFHDKLHFGPRDMMSKYLEDLKGYTYLTENSTSSDVEDWLHSGFSSNIKRCLEPLLKNVPFRFLSPWIKYTSNEDVIEKSNSADYAAIYAIHEDMIIMDEDWFDYIIENYDDVYSFAKESFADYLKLYNNGLSLV